MEKMEAALREWLAAEPEMVSLAKIQTDLALQPRAEELVPFRHKGRLEGYSGEHVTRMRAILEARKEAQLEPLLVARIADVLYVVDGHHRLKAYKLAKRRTVPARVRELDYKEAVLLSKLVNLGGAKLPLYAEQARDAAWQYLAEVTDRGSLSPPQGESTRTIAARFGISHDTIASMLKRLPTVEWTEYGPSQRDPGTDWPRWRYVKENSKWMGDLAPPEWRRDRRAGKVAVSLFKKIDLWGSEVVWLGLAKFIQETAEEELEGYREMLQGVLEGGPAVLPKEDDF